MESNHTTVVTGVIYVADSWAKGFPDGEEEAVLSILLWN
jgi:hypothetical protein